MLESRDRLGGRIYTDYTNGFPVDMGASWYEVAPYISKRSGILTNSTSDQVVVIVVVGYME